MALFRCGGGQVTLTQIGTATIASTTATAVNLSESMSNYQFIFITQRQFDGDKIPDDDNGSAGFVFARPSEFSSNRTLYWRMGSGTVTTTTVVEADATTLTFTQATASSRTYYVYGIN